MSVKLLVDGAGTKLPYDKHHAVMPGTFDVASRENTMTAEDTAPSRTGALPMKWLTQSGNTWPKKLPALSTKEGRTLG